MPPDLWSGVIAGLVIGLPLVGLALSNPSPIYLGRRRRSTPDVPSASDSHSGQAGTGVGTSGAPLTDVPTSPSHERSGRGIR